MRGLLLLAVAALVFGLWAFFRARRADDEAFPHAEVDPDARRRRSLPIEAVNAEAGRIATEVSSAVGKVGTALDANMTTQEVADRVVGLLSAGIEPAMKGFNGYPASACVSVNEEVLHGIPSHKRHLANGDLVTIQLTGKTATAFGAIGWTFPVGEVSADVKRLHDAGLAALESAIAQVKPGVRTGDIGAAIQLAVENAGFAVVRDYLGYTMGAEMIQGPQLPGYGQAGAGPGLKEGTVLNIHVIAKQGDFRVMTREDGWTVTGAPGELSVLFTAMVLITPEGKQVLTPMLTKPLAAL